MVTRGHDGLSRKQHVAELLRETGVGERLDREGLVHHGINMSFGIEARRLATEEFDRLLEWLHENLDSKS